MKIVDIVEGYFDATFNFYRVTVGSTYTPDEALYNDRAVIYVCAGVDSASDKALMAGSGSPTPTELIGSQVLTCPAYSLYFGAWWLPRTDLNVLSKAFGLTSNGGLSFNTSSTNFKAWGIIVSDVSDVDSAYDGVSPATSSITFPEIDILRPGDLSLLVAAFDDPTTGITTPTGYTVEKIQEGEHATKWSFALYSKEETNQANLSVTTSLTGAVWHAAHITPNGIPLRALFGGDF